ncbi:HNH endonuclease [Brachybacterium sp. AOP43-C2-M15]|uniref:HNH endonuclease n=1 Tax=Brachybacterium sp. AOP43-C2-M15 TaxID=3457661 RepID=UPI0040333944
MRARRPLDEASLLEEVEPGSLEAGRVLRLHATLRARASLHAHLLRQLALFFRDDPEVRGVPEDADLTGVKVAVGLRTSTRRAWGQVLDAHTAVDLMPRTFAFLARGEMPEHFHQYLLRQVRRLTDEQKRVVDEHMAGVEIPAVSQATFEAQARLAVRLASAGSVPVPASTSRNVEVVDVNTETGTASLYVTGPIPEIQGLAHRLDVAARTVQQAQRAALADGTEGSVPFDIDQDLRERGRALSLARLRYAILTHSILDIDPVQETRTPYKILVTIPVTTLLGLDDAPGMLDGLTPLPAEQARVLAADAPTWLRILTDPLTGAHLPAVAESYPPTAQMRLQLRLRHPVCAVPGCERPTRIAAEDDHILEYDHSDPGAGGPTSLANLHRLCWQHHQLKTAGRLDPTRTPDPDHPGDAAPGGATRAGPVSTDWDIDGEVRTRTYEHTDLLSPHTAAALERAWRTHLRAHEDAVRLHDQEKSRPHAERAAEQRRHALAIAYPHLRDRLLPDPHTPPEDDTDPPF